MKVWISSLLLCFSLGFRLIGLGQVGTLHGRLTDKLGNGLDSVRIEVPHANQFTTSDSLGNYVLELPAGRYYVFFKNPWYKTWTEVRNFASSADILLNVNLGEPYTLPEVEISDGDDPKDSSTNDEGVDQKLPVDPKRIVEIGCGMRVSEAPQAKPSK